MDTSTVLERPKVSARLYTWLPGNDPRVAQAKTLHAKWAPILEDAVNEALTYPGPDDFAAMLELAGIKGRTGNSTKCAAAAWFQQATGNPLLRVSGTIAIPLDTPEGERVGTTAVNAPGVVVAFYNNFDAGYYPRLHERSYTGRLL